ncbi:hypothetical protein ACQEVZ_12105 [Dactylosporangium sp. CA-152071]|uniref:hypothetical protein n=1 Tax=Dactylosporangium sp. CA-152071 TaxID=3239933 RepID=UPI003D8E0E10
MELELRSRLADELSAGPEPPIGDLVAASILQGRRLRVTRRLRHGAAALLAVLVTTGLVGGWAVLRPGAAQVGAPALAGPLVPATPAGLLVLLESLLPEGVTSGYAGSADGGLMVQVYLDTGRGPGMLRVAVGRDTNGPLGADERAKLSQGAVTGPFRRPDGAEVTVAYLPDNCVQRTVVVLHRPDRVVVQVNIAACLAWDGTANAEAPQVLTAVQAEAVAADPRWGVMIPRSLVDAGAARHPTLPELA